MRTRVLSALIGAPLVIAVILWPGGGVWFPGWPFAVLVLAMLLVGLSEFYSGCREAGRVPLEGFGYGAVVLFWLISTPIVPNAEQRLFPFVLTVLVVAGFLLEIGRSDRAPLQNLAPTWLGILFLGWLLPFALRLRLMAYGGAPQLHWIPTSPLVQTTGGGAWLLLFTMLSTSAVDTGAYFAGKSLGKHKLAPVLSPGKTWEGAVGGFLCAMLVAGLLGSWLRLPLAFSLTAGALVGIFAQLGDLSKSAIKREIGIKDFGSLIPGHGGVLDRFDSLLFTAPIVYWLVTFWPR